MKNIILLLAFLPLYVKSQCTTQFDKVTEKKSATASIKCFKKLTDKSKLDLSIKREDENAWISIRATIDNYAIGSKTDSLIIKLSDKTVLHLQPALPFVGECNQIGNTGFYSYSCDYWISKNMLLQLTEKELTIIRVPFNIKYLKDFELPKSAQDEIKKAVQCIAKD